MKDLARIGLPIGKSCYSRHVSGRPCQDEYKPAGQMPISIKFKNVFFDLELLFLLPRRNDF